MIELIIDGKKITAKEGDTILQAALKNGIYIPTLCNDRRLKPYGGCRMCVVEIEGISKLATSCGYPVKEGFVVKTDTPRVRRVRQSVLEFLLVHHPLDCPICDKAGECGLQDLAFQYGSPAPRFEEERKHAEADIRGPLVELVANRCILCAKCVRICAHHQGRGALGLIGRGFDTVVKAAFGDALWCDFCGQCIDICPTGALISKPYKYKARPWFLDEKENVCPFCGVGCTLTLGIREGKILRSRGKEKVGITDGNLCGRGRFGFDYVYSENRLKTPLIKQDGGFKNVSWEEALSYISKNLREIKKAHGPESIGAIGSSRCTIEDNYMLKKFMDVGLGSKNIDSSEAFGYMNALKAFSLSFGVKNNPADLKSPIGKDVILVLESDVSITHPIFGLNILQAKNEGANLMVGDCRETKLTRHSSAWLKLKPGTLVAFLNGMMKVIIDKGLFDRNKASRGAGLSSLEDMLKEYTSDKISEITGLTDEELTAAAETFAKAPRKLIAMSLCPSENNKGLSSALAAANLLLLLGEEASSLQILANHCNTFGMLEAGIMPSDGAKGASDMLYKPGSLKALYIMGEDPVVNMPDAKKIRETLNSLDFLIVQDIEMTETAKLAHVVLPASSWAEKNGNFLNAEGLMQGVRKIVETTGESLPDWMILRNLGLIMGIDLGVKNLEDITREVAGLISQKEKGDVKLMFHPTPHKSEETPDNEFNLTLVTRDVLQHSGNMSTRSETLKLVRSEPHLRINIKDAKKQDISDDSHIRIISRRGAAFLRAKVSDDVPEGVVFTSVHFPHGRLNELTHLSSNGCSRLDAVKIEKVEVNK